MSKSTKQFLRKEPNRERLKIKNQYLNYFKNLFMTNYEFKGVEKKENWFILHAYWETGKISGFILNEAGVKIPAYANFTENMYDMYNYPINALPIAISSDWKLPKYMPKTPLKVDKEIVISYINKTRTPIKEMVIYYVNRIVQIEMLMNSHINKLKMPFLVAVSPEDKEKMEDIIDRILNDEEVVYLSANDIANLKTLINNTPYILDKLLQHEKALINEVLTRLGINNVDIEKKEHLIVDEANANNELISDNGDIYLKEMEKFCEECNALLGTSMSVESTTAAHLLENMNQEDTSEEEENEDDSNN